jgi:hypothetical protein
MSGMCAFEVSLGSKCRDRLSHSPTIRLAIRFSILNCVDGQTSSSLPHALPIRFLKLRMESVTTLRYDPLLLPQGLRLRRMDAQTSLLRALAPSTPTYVFPAMNTSMYNHPLTNEHLRVVKEVIGYYVVGPIGKTLPCGDVGEEKSPVHRSAAKPS